jgi:photosystem II stability/assembly factor-like uncharacterized protein
MELENDYQFHIQKGASAMKRMMLLVTLLTTLGVEAQVIEMEGRPFARISSLSDAHAPSSLAKTSGTGGPLRFTWISPETLRTSTRFNIRDLCYDSTRKVLLAAAVGGGLWEISNDGSTWVRLGEHTGLTDSYILSIARTLDGKLFVATFPSGLFTSADNGATWEELTGGRGNGLPHDTWGLSVAVNPEGMVVFTTYQYGIFVSRDNGITWNTANKNLPSYEGTDGQTRYRGVIAPIFIGEKTLVSAVDTTDCFNLGLGRPYGADSLTPTAPWQRTNAGIDSGEVSDMLVTSRGSILAGGLSYAATCSGNTGKSANSHLYRSTDGGATWDRVVTAMNVWNGLAQYQDVIYAAADWGALDAHRGFYRSTDDGAMWERLDGYDSIDTLGILSLQSVAFDDSGYAYVGSSMGVFRSTEPVTSFLTAVERIEEAMVPSGFTLRQNYPNPFNPTTMIEFTLPERAFITIKVVNLLGQEVATLVAEEVPAGTHRTTWDASGFPSGIYFARLEASNFVATKKMVLMK